MKKIIPNLKSFIIKSDQISSAVELNSMLDTGNRHRNFVGGLLTIFAFFISAAISFYFLSFLFIKTNPTAFKIEIFSDDIPKISTDPNSMFFSVSYLSFSNYTINESVISFYGRLYQNVNQQAIKILYEYKFDRCNTIDGEAVKNYFTTKQIDNFYHDFFCLSAMIVNNTEISIRSPNFIYPYIQYGMSSRNNLPIFFEIGAQKCQNTTNNNSCIPDEEIDKIIDSGYYRFSFIDNYFNQMDYDNPIKKFGNFISGVTKKGYTSRNYLNYNYVKFVTHDGFIFDQTSEIPAYQYSDRQEFSSQSTDDTIFNFAVFLQNYPITYDRTYVSLQEILANIGGIIKVLFIIAQILNSSYQKFINDKFFFSHVINKYMCKYPKKPDRLFTDENQINFIIKSNEPHSEPEIPDEKEIFEQKTLEKKEKIAAQQFQKDSNNFQLPVIENQIKSPREFKRKDQKIGRTVLMNSTIFDKPLKLSWSEYLCLKFQKIWTKKENHEEFSNIEKNDNIKKKVLNEDTIYKCFFEIEKLKKIIFDEKQQEIFKYCRLDAENTFEKNQFVMTDKEMIIHLDKIKEHSETKFIDSRLKEMLLSTLKGISNT